MPQKKILIDLIKLREQGATKAEAIDPTLLNGEGLKTIRELATFRYTCRRCKDAPCINVCPADALEKDEEGMVVRSLNLCIRCKSCIAVCPFGTLMNDLFEVKTSGYQFFDLTDEEALKRFVNSFPEDVVSYTEEEENEEMHLYQLSDQVLVKEYAWAEEKV